MEGYGPEAHCDDSMHVQCKVVASALHAKSIFLDDLDQAGLVLNVPISLLEPMQCGCWLGFLIDLLKGTFQIPQDPIQKLHEYLRSAGPIQRASASVLYSQHCRAESHYTLTCSWSVCSEI